LIPPAEVEQNPALWLTIVSQHRGLLYQCVDLVVVTVVVVMVVVVVVMVLVVVVVVL